MQPGVKRGSVSQVDKQFTSKKTLNDVTIDDENQNNLTQNSMVPLNKTMPYDGTIVVNGRKEEKKAG